MHAGSVCFVLTIALLACACGRTVPLRAPDEDATMDGGVDSAPDSGPLGPVDYETYCGRLADAYADYLDDCIGSPLGFYDLTGGARWRQACLSFSGSVESGRVSFDGAAAAACLAALEREAALFCPDLVFYADEPACDGLFSGTVAEGGACFHFGTTGVVGSECATGYCRTDTCPGTCASYRAEGQPCNVSEALLCGDGLFCRSGICAQTADEGEPCAAGRPCAPDLACMPMSAPDATCRELGRVGDGCVTSEDCWGPAVCERSICTSKVERGGPCRLYLNCPEGQSCFGESALPPEDGACVDRGPTGTPCTHDGNCLPGLFCAGIDPEPVGACEARRTLGDGCADDLPCRADGWCAPQPGGAFACARRGADGEPCIDAVGLLGDYDQSCQDGLLCMDDGRCHPLGDAGAPCRTEFRFSCDYGLWCADSAQCAPQVSRGEACLDDRHCETLNCADGVCDYARTCADL